MTQRSNRRFDMILHVPLLLRDVVLDQLLLENFFRQDIENR